jgi:Uma2 family endonuclease
VTTSASPVDDQSELRAWLTERDARYEVIDGVVLVSPPDRVAHSGRTLRIAAALLVAAPEDMEVLGPNCAVYYDRQAPKDFVMPDVLVAHAEHVDADGLRNPPLLVVEVLSRSTRRRDRGEKRDIYAELGVPHYWLVDSERHTATVMRLAGGAYDEVLTAVGELIAEVPFAVRVPL